MEDLRQRRGGGSLANNDASGEIGQSGGDGRRLSKAKSVRRLSYHVSTPQSSRLTDAQARVFLNMYTRKLDRRVRGTRSNDSLCCEFFVVLILVVVVTVLGWDNSPENQEYTLTEGDIVGIALLVVWWIVALAIFFVWGDSPYAKMLRYMVIYIPLIVSVFSLSFYHEIRHRREANPYIPAGHYWVLVILIILEVLTFLGFMSYYNFFPMFVKSEWFRRDPGKVARLWKVGIVQDWVMNYRGHNPKHGSVKCNLNYTCKYAGSTDPDTGLPDGLGRWLDDAWEGETLTGYWKQGEPVAPFSSWNVGTDDAVVAVRVAYFKATDDPFGKNKFKSTNAQPPECGVASVECSVSGSFYKHLPQATLIEGPYGVESMPTDRTNPIREVLSHMIHVGEACEDADHVHDDGRGVSTIKIRATDPRGVQVLGHVYEPTGRFYAPDAKSITVEVDWGDAVEESKAVAGAGERRPELSKSTQLRQSARFLQKTLFMPKADPTPLSKLVEVEVEDDSDEEISDEEIIDLEEGQQPQSAEVASVKQRRRTYHERRATLRVQNWAPYQYKEALVFLPGYNSTTEARLSSFGQFLAMTKLSRHVYPFVFLNPGSSGPGYFYASNITNTDANEESLLKLFQGLRAAGITRCHILTHSMGVQTLLGAFRDKYNEKGERIGRSDVSMCFQLDPELDETEGPKEGRRQQYGNQMLCKSITILNADFPVKAFVDRGFLSIRRICKTITVVGDRNDRALKWSSIFNGVAPHVDRYERPEYMKPTLTCEETNWELAERIGRNIGELYFSPEEAQRQCKSGDDKAFPNRLLFNKVGPIGVSGTQTRAWLDLDVIDMTGLDTNIKGMRHSGFSLNAMLLQDLEELISSGKRAMKRSSLLYREGNVFSYAHAPSFVVQ
ncbi:hypothetical protein ACHAXT_011338 [Thalassiosira profunda]